MSTSPAPKQTYAQQKAALNQLYSNPLPLTFPNPPPLPTTFLSALFSPSYSPLSPYNLSLLSPSQKMINPKCVGVWDQLTQSVWIQSKHDMRILWTRGNFGKGSLSRSEPSWLGRKVNELNRDSSTYSAEEITQMRRNERKQFKKERALASVLTVEAAERRLLLAKEKQQQSQSAPSTPGSTTSALPATNSETLEEEEEIPEVVMPKRPTNKIYSKEPTTENGSVTQKEKKVEVTEDEIENLEWLQLDRWEVWFLAWGLGCLTVVDSKTKEPLKLTSLLPLLLTTPSPTFPCVTTANPAIINPSDPFLINYIAYHHFRSHGWVVRPGIKFCVDWLLYKKGVVFSHAEFAVLVLPVPNKEDVAEGEEGIKWAWLSTVNRVNSQVKKTLILSYIQIPSIASVNALMQSSSPSSTVNKLDFDFHELLKLYTVKEVTVRRFVPARMRD